jgi:hypothetical protein
MKHLAILALCLLSGCVSTTFRKGDMEMTRRCPAWNQVGIGEVVFFDGTNIVAKMTGYKNDGTAEAIKALGNTLKSAGEALGRTAVETVK